MTEGIELPNQEKIKTFGEKETYKYLGYRNRIPSNKGRWKENLKNILTENEKISQNQNISQKFN